MGGGHFCAEPEPFLPEGLQASVPLTLASQFLQGGCFADMPRLGALGTLANFGS